MAANERQCQISNWRLLRLTVRCLFIQSSWNYRQFQGLGWVATMMPELKRLYNSTQLTAVVKKYAKYFNTNTFFAPSIAGAALAIEVDQCRGTAVPMPADSYVDAVMAPVAAVGDSLFWGGVRPFLSCLAVALAAYGVWWSPLVLVVGFNLVSGFFRLSGTWIGYRRGVAVVELIQSGHLADVALVLKRLTVVVLGGLCAVLAHNTHVVSGWPLGDSLILVTIVFTAVSLLRRGVPTAVVLCAIVVVVTMVDKLLM